MCRKVTCSTCNKPTYAGCGAHIEQVLGHIPHEKRCRCREDRVSSDPQGSHRWLHNLFGKGQSR